MSTSRSLAVSQSEGVAATRRGPSNGPLTTCAPSQATAFSLGTGSNTSLRAQLRKERRREVSCASTSAGSEALKVAGSSDALASAATFGPSSVPPPTSSTAPLVSGRKRLAPNATGHPLNAPKSRESVISSEEHRKPYRSHSPLPPAEPTSISAHEAQPPSNLPFDPDRSLGVEALHSAFSAKWNEMTGKYYEMAKKCRDWERYCAKLRIQAEGFSSERNRLKELTAQHEGIIDRLEEEIASVRAESRNIDEHRHRLAERVILLERMLTVREGASSRQGHNLPGPDSFGPSLPSDRLNAPSPPISTSLSQTFDTATVSMHAGSNMEPWCSSNLLDRQTVSNNRRGFSREGSSGPIDGACVDLHPSWSNVVPGSWINGQREHHSAESIADIVLADAENREAGALFGDGRASRMAEYDPINRSQLLRGRGLMTESEQELSGYQHQQHTASQSYASTFGGQQSLGLGSTQPAVADYQRQRRPSAAHTVAIAGPSLPRDVASSSHTGPMPSLSRQRSDTVVITSGSAHAEAALPKRRSTNTDGTGLMSGNSTMASASLPSLAPEGNNRRGLPVASDAQVHRQSHGALTAPARGGSAVSDASTVTGAYLADTLQARKQLRRTSLTQQQQLQALQAQHGRRSAGPADEEPSAPLAPPQAFINRPSSRATSRLSTGSHGGIERARARGTRSRNGSTSVHDSIPVQKDDIFSSSEERILKQAIEAQTLPSRSTFKRTISDSALITDEAGPVSHHQFSSSTLAQGTSPAAQVRDGGINSSSSESPANSSSAGSKHGSPVYEHTASGHLDVSQSDPTPSSVPRRRGASNENPAHSESISHVHSSDDIVEYPQDLTEEGKRLALRRLYIRLKEELSEEELAKFERYIQRYDRLEMPLEGPRGLLNRFKKLLLHTDPNIRANDRQRWALRKDLARAFEHIVRLDVEAHAQQEETYVEQEAARMQNEEMQRELSFDEDDL
ncbi:hypothetical protein CBOM_00347 [Ceraceosorus bombacis]|uniref:Uncharacterized protein n=1 Tax=Ceraceosorus bombacis TaxID=401625 RepID=A0A0P1B9S7_9BASI|nr:hypothetical protein CBOM_00347 [Ceraceosorus bombacis]